MFAIAAVVIALAFIFGTALGRRARIEQASFNQHFDAHTEQ